MRAPRYYTLVASLPRLPHFEVAERLPLSPWKMDRRLGLLSDEHRAELLAAARLAGWEHQPLSRTDAQFVALYERTLDTIRDGGLRAFLEYRMEQRTIVVALRRRLAGGERPLPTEPWGVGRWRTALPLRWELPDFGLSGRYPWLPEALERLRTGDAFALERLLLDVIWRELDGIAEQEPFSFGAVYSYYFRWDLVRRWLDYGEPAARERFADLRREIIEEHGEIGL